MNTAEMALTFAVLCSLVVTAVLMIVALAGGHLKERVFRWFFVLLTVCLIAMAADVATGWLSLRFGAAARHAIHIMQFLNSAASGLGFVAYGQYLRAFFSLKTHVSRRYSDVINWLGAAILVVAVVEPFTDAFYWLDESGFYNNGPLSWVVYLLSTLALCTALTFIFRYRRALSTKELIPLMLYPVAPIICYVFEVFFDSAWVSPVGAALMLLLIYVSIQMDLKKKLVTQDAELTDSRIAIMLSQIQPHFLYNALTTIDNLMYTDLQSAHEALYTFSDYLRGNMDSLSERRLIPFEQELEHTRQYLQLEKMRFSDMLEIVYEIRATDFWLPVLTLQPIVENAVRYGASKNPNGGTVTIRTEDAGTCYRITVEDDGAGFDPDRLPPLDGLDGRSHMGIANVRARLEAMCGGRLTIRSAPGAGTSATIEIPREAKP